MDAIERHRRYRAVADPDAVAVAAARRSAHSVDAIVAVDGIARDAAVGSSRAERAVEWIELMLTR